MTIYANLVIGQDGSTTNGGKSSGLSSQEDRRRFHNLRNKVDVIFIGGRTARTEPYKRTPKPLVIVSRSEKVVEVAENDLAEISNQTPLEALKYAQNKFGENILVEGGPNLLNEVISIVDELYITISMKTGDGQIVSFDGLTRDFIMEDMEKIDGEIFYRFKRSR